MRTACVVTRSMSREASIEVREVSKYAVLGLSTLPSISQRELVTAQQNCPGLQKLFADVISVEDLRSEVLSMGISSKMSYSQGRIYLAKRLDGGTCYSGGGTKAISRGSNESCTW